MNAAELGQKVKAKYPEYNDIPDDEVGRRVSQKYPEYQIEDSKAQSQPQLKSIYPPTETERGGTSPSDIALSTLEGTGRDLAAIPAHFINQVGMNYPRSLTQKAGYKYPEDTTSPVAGALAKTAGLVGAIKNPVAKTLGLGAEGTSLARNMASSAAIGGAYAPTDNPVGLKERGVNALVSGLVPLGLKGASKVGQAIPQGMKNAGLSMVESAIKKYPKYAAYGSDPRLGIVGEGITGSSPEEIQFKAQNRLEELGKYKGEILNSPEHANKAINVSGYSDSVDTAIANAKKAPETNSSLISRLNGLKNDLDGLTKGKDLTQLSPAEADQLKQEIGKLTKFTGNPSDDQAFNMAKKQAFGHVMSKIEEAVPQVKEANGRWANVKSAIDALQNGDMFSGKEGQILNIGSRAGIWAGLGGLFTGNLPLAAGGVGEHLIAKALGEPGVKTNVSKALYEGGQALEEGGGKAGGFVKNLVNRVRGMKVNQRVPMQNGPWPQRVAPTDMGPYGAGPKGGGGNYSGPDVPVNTRHNLVDMMENYLGGKGKISASPEQADFYQEPQNPYPYRGGAGNYQGEYPPSAPPSPETIKYQGGKGKVNAPYSEPSAQELRQGTNERVGKAGKFAEPSSEPHQPYGKNLPMKELIKRAKRGRN